MMLSWGPTPASWHAPDVLAVPDGELPPGGFAEIAFTLAASSVLGRAVIETFAPGAHPAPLLSQPFVWARLARRRRRLRRPPPHRAP